MRWPAMNEALSDYVVAHSNPSGDPIAERLAASTEERFGGLAAMNIGEDEGRFLQMLVSMTGARTVVEIGTFTGMSALWLARGLPADGRLHCFELEDDYLATAMEAWTAAGVADRIEMHFGPAAATLAEFPARPHIDVAFVDANKDGYRTYLDLLLPRLNPDGVIAIDNVIWSGAVIDPSVTNDNTEAIRAFNDHVAARTDVDAVMLTIGDGVTLIRKRG
ncbi:MAG: O-methyltransferase [Ilumatobacteraceae bacterium]